MYLSIDIETYSDVDLTKSGVYAYSDSPNFTVLLVAYAFEDEETKIVDLAWLLYQCYADQGYTQSKTYAIDAERSAMHTYWTQKGRLFLYDLLKNECGLLPVIERRLSA